MLRGRGKQGAGAGQGTGGKHWLGVAGRTGAIGCRWRIRALRTCQRSQRRGYCSSSIFRKGQVIRVGRVVVAEVDLHDVEVAAVLDGVERTTCTWNRTEAPPGTTIDSASSPMGRPLACPPEFGQVEQAATVRLEERDLLAGVAREDRQRGAVERIAVAIRSPSGPAEQPEGGAHSRTLWCPEKKPVSASTRHTPVNLNIVNALMTAMARSGSAKGRRRCQAVSEP